MAGLCRCNNVEPILTTVIPVGREHDVFKSDAFQPYVVSDSLAKFNLWLREFCAQQGYRLADFNGALANEDGYLPDNLSIDNTHLNRAGCLRLKEVVLRAIESLNQGSVSEMKR